MKKILLVAFLIYFKNSIAQIQAIFNQDFSSSTEVNSYANLTAPLVNQFTAISSYGTQKSTIVNGVLRFTKTGASSSNFVKSNSFVSAPKFLHISFKFQLSGNESTNQTDFQARFFVGDGFTNDATVPTDATNVHSKFAFLYTGDGAFKIKDMKSGVLSPEFSGQQKITFVINNSDAPRRYKDPNGNIEWVGDDQWDLWVGYTKIFDNSAAQTGSIPLNNFKFMGQSGAINAITEFDDFVIYDDHIIEPTPLWLSEVKYQAPVSGIYLGSPSILRLDNGDILASHDYFGPNRPRDAAGRSNQSSVYKSSDNGQTWTHLTDITGIYWATLFKHNGAVYLLGTSAAGASIVIIKSTDNGLTWTQPINSTTGFLFGEGANGIPPIYGCAPTPVVKHNGRLYRAFENTANTTLVGYRGVTLMILSIDENDDLLDASKWTKSNELTFNGAWDPPGSAATTGWLEGNVVDGPDGKLWIMPRVNSTPFFDRSAMIEITNNGQTITFTPANFINFPGGSCKFVIRKDTTTNIYWAMLNDNTNGVESNQRNVLALYASINLKDWYYAKTLIEDDQGYTETQSIELTGFQYPDWQFDGDHMIYLSRTAYGDGVPRAHDSNYITFGMVENYRSYTPEAILEILGVPDNYGQLFYQDFESSTDKADYIGSGANMFGSIHSANSSSTTSAIETEAGNKFLRFNKTGNTTSVITRGITLSNTSSIAVLKFRFRFTPSVILSTTQSEILTFFLGDETESGEVTTTYFNDNDTNNPPTANLFYTANLRVIKSNGQAGTVAGNDYVFASATSTYFPVSDWNEITIVANNTTGPLAYKGPNGSNYTVTPTTTDGGVTYTGRGDMWIGTTRVAQNVSLGAMKVLNKFKIRIPAGFPNGTIDIDDIRIYRDFSVLPVTFTSFTGKQGGSSAQLNWQTASESNNSHFNILSAGENRKFIKIGEIKGSGNTSVGANYSFTDYNPVPGTNYYKLQQVDLNNTVNEYGEIVSVKMGSGQGESFVISSFDDGSLNIVFYAARESIDGRITITDVSGRQLASKQLKVNGGYNEVKIVQYLQKGVYVVSLLTDGKTISTKFIK